LQLRRSREALEAPTRASPMHKLPVVDRISLGLGNALSLLFLAAVALTVYEVVLRYAFNAPTIWVHDMVIVLSAICFVFGGAVASQRRTHIQMASYFDQAPPKVRGFLDQLCHALSALFLAMFLYGALRIAVPSLQLMETSGRAWDVPIPAFLKTMLAAGAALMLAQALSHLRHRRPQRRESSETIV
jgi:TRAP-type C4-dicarboxylate transport system permease small subunit